MLGHKFTSVRINLCCCFTQQKSIISYICILTIGGNLLIYLATFLLHMQSYLAAIDIAFDSHEAFFRFR
jgi:hypothetical protein